MRDWIGLVFAIFFAGVVWSFLLHQKSGIKSQPIAFNHKKHLELGLECGFCHTGIAEAKAHAGLPQIETCLGCHAAEETNPKALAVQTYASENQPIPWEQVYRLPQDVYFSHRRHVEIAKLDCALCHGDMMNKETPVTRQAIPIKMERCMECHQKNRVTNDCLSCHK